ncbi:MAG: hypothetical protein KME03_16455 [Aphanocapsa lilacina HA4352-LM1]|jgi:hypothetical protein|uniref:Uncharacterized protein n=1 Tax=Gloeobacter morelensis MG652769 TaxID=2781736 RepID=A0ABY3PGV6_9CYAN|nr:hypothetical protein [Gloeobacter morelensis]MBW4699452.1 hypothetical protein [Aphanocapsa lilacina HA4352-LM1]UFP92814.1 hypothetical protein ISF26_13350 [Gloeobacter morelensis MG652769]
MNPQGPDPEIDLRDVLRERERAIEAMGARAYDTAVLEAIAHLAVSDILWPEKAIELLKPYLQGRFGPHGASVGIAALQRLADDA